MRGGVVESTIDDKLLGIDQHILVLDGAEAISFRIGGMCAGEWLRAPSTISCSV